MQNLINVNIRPHLVSFLFEELEGETQANYEGKKVKLARVSRSSVLGQMIETFKVLSSIENKARLSSYGIFLSITKQGEKTGTFHGKYNNNYEVLTLQKDHVFLINEYLESIFRISAVEFIKGFAKNSSSLKFVDEAIEQFMIAHNLYNTEIDPISIRRFYYNSLKKNHSLSRLQNQIGNRSKYFYSA